MYPSWDVAALQLALALLLDWAIGEYPSFVHPVVWIGTGTKLLLRLAPVASEGQGRWYRQFTFGALLVVVICVLTGLGTLFVLRLAEDSFAIQIIVGSVVLKSSFALRELCRAARRVADGLQVDLSRAREALRSLCSRDPTKLDAKELIAGTVESLAENLSDSFVAPLFYFMLFGIPGAMVYRAINTLDAMIGYRGEYEALGKTAARLDDVVNWIPARLTALLLLLAGLVMRADVSEGMHILRHDANKTPSPNGGRPMAVMAGLLGVQLEKKGVYILGDPGRELTVGTIGVAVRLVLVAALLFVCFLLAIACGAACGER